jgi:hypothetical protein
MGQLVCRYTPACFMSTVSPSTAYDAGIMLTVELYKLNSAPELNHSLKAKYDLLDSRFAFKFNLCRSIAASHLPFNRNGMKFFTAAGGLDKVGLALFITLCCSKKSS